MDSTHICTCAEHLAMATIPKQEWCDPYDFATALAEGTIFPCLINFAINDLTLYLDTHPNCPKGTALFHQLLEQRLALLSDFAGKFYPLTQTSMVTGKYDQTQYGWSEGPMPWEGACI